MTANTKKSREQAEISFSKTQTQSMALNRINAERDAVSDAREAKTIRLRELRLEKEANDLAEAAMATAAPKRKAKN